MSTIKEDVQFIFSKDCPVQKQSRYISAAGTAIFWLVLLIVLAVAPSFKPKEKYKTVQIVLAAPEKKVTPKKESAAAQQAAAAPKQETAAQPVQEPQTPPPAPKKVEQPKVEKPAAKQPAKTQTQPKAAPKTESKPAPAKTPVKTPEVVEYARDMSDGVDFGAPAKKTAATWDDVDFNDSAVSQSSAVNQNQTVESKSGISGSAGTHSNSNTSKTSTQTNTNTSNSGVTAGLKDSLGQIADTKVASNSQSLAGSSNVKALVDNGDFKWADGRVRNMWYPASPDIKISQENSPGMSLDVEITFTVTDMGAVTNIQFVQNALLSEGLKAEIRRQISKWMFDEADSASNARFLLKIRTK